jgi:hypothetical protein
MRTTWIECSVSAGGAPATCGPSRIRNSISTEPVVIARVGRASIAKPTAETANRMSAVFEEVRFLFGAWEGECHTSAVARLSAQNPTRTGRVVALTALSEELEWDSETLIYNHPDTPFIQADTILAFCDYLYRIAIMCFAFYKPAENAWLVTYARMHNWRAHLLERGLLEHRTVSPE